MILAVFLIAGIIAALGLCAAKAPIGFEDDTGFHFGRPNQIGSDAARILVRISQDATPKCQERIIPAPSIRSLWLRPALGMAALVTMLLVLLPKEQEKAKPLTFRTNSRLTELKTVSKTLSKPIHRESSKFVQRLCQRFDPVE